MGDDDNKLQKFYSSFDLLLKKLKQKFELKLRETLLDNAKLGDFKIMQTLGTGSFGRVVLCKYKTNDKLYAMKVMEKANIMQAKQLAHTMAEIRCMHALEFPFLVNLEFFFKNNVYIFIVMPFVTGGEMFYHLRREKKFDETLCRFYAAQVVMLFDYIHYMGIIYRDLKPENIMIDTEGYIKVADLGFCKKIDNKRTYTLCGTPEYLAPEIILSQGYNQSVDWWALGILIYEMAAGYPPFYAKDPMRLYDKIVSAKYSFPGHFSRQLKDLVTNILQVDRSRRYGVLKAGSKDIKGHEWFKTVDFDQILNRRYKPFYKPTLTKEDDTKYFDSYDELHLRSSPSNEYEEEFKDISM